MALLSLAGLGFQRHTTLVASAATLPWARAAWAPLFCIGFALGLLLSSRALAPLAPSRRLGTAADALAVGGLAALLAGGSLPPVAFVPAQALAGAAWGVTLHTGLSLALSRSSAQRLATPVGLVFSALALAALCRVAVVALQWQGVPACGVLPCLVWLGAALGFWRHPWRTGAAVPATAAVPGAGRVVGPGR